MGSLIRLACLSLGLWLATASTLAQTAGEQARRVSLDLTLCDAAVDAEALARQLGLELRAHGFVVVANQQNELILVLGFPDCVAGARTAELSLRSATQTQVTSRRLDMTDTSRDDRPRALALCAAELLRPALPLNTQVEPAPEPVVKAPVPDQKRDEAPASSARMLAEPSLSPAHARLHRRFSLGGQAVSQHLLGEAQGLSGAALVARALALPYLELGLTLQALTGRNDVALGRYRVSSLLSVLSVSAGGGERLRGYAGPRLLFGESFARGVGDRAGTANDSVRDLSLGLAVGLGVRARLNERWSLGMELGAGSFLRGLTIRVDGYPVASTRGSFVDASLGLLLTL